MIVIPALSPAAPAAASTPALSPVNPAATVTAVGTGGSAAAGGEANLAEQRNPAPRLPAERRKPQAEPQRAPVLALMRQAEAVVRMANAPGTQGQPPGGYRLAMAQAQSGVKVSGNLIVESEAGLKIGSGRIYQAGDLVASFSGPNLAFVGQVDKLL